MIVFDNFPEIVGVTDLDDSAFAFSRLYAKRCTEILGRKFNELDFWGKDLAKVVGLPEPKALALRDEIFAGNFYPLMEPMPGAVEAVSFLSRRRGLRHVATSRKGDYACQTQESVTRHFNHHLREIHLTYNNHANHGSKSWTKGDVCLSLDADYIIEDILSYALDVVKKTDGRTHVFFFDPYALQKELPAGMQPVRSWEEIVKAVL